MTSTEQSPPPNASQPSCREIVTVTGTSSDGSGVARLESGKVAFIPFALPGETVSIEITQRKKSYNIGKIVEILQPADDRRTPPCPVFQVCGGCQLQHAEETSQIDMKWKWLLDACVRIGNWGQDALNRLTLSQTAPQQPLEPFHYRIRARFHLDWSGDTLELGFQRQDSSTGPVSSTECAILHPEMQRSLPSLRAALVDLPQVKPCLPLQIELTYLESTQELAVSLYTQGRKRQAPPRKLEQQVARAFQQKLSADCCDGLQVLLPGANQDLLLILGKPDFWIHRQGFLQPHKEAAALYQTKALTAFECLHNRVQKRDRDPKSPLIVWDLYGGCGLLSLPLLRQKRTPVDVHLVELSGPSTIAAERNLQLENAAHSDSRVQIHNMSVERFLRPSRQSPHFIIADPPRSGLGAEVCQALIGLAEGVSAAELDPLDLFLVFCDPGAMARDVGRLLASGHFVLHSLLDVDAFPQTRHHEVLVCLTVSGRARQTEQWDTE